MAALGIILVSAGTVTLASATTGAATSAPPPAFKLRPHAAPLPIPTPEQLRYQGSMNALIHFGMASKYHQRRKPTHRARQPLTSPPANIRLAPPLPFAAFFHDGDPGCDANNWRGCDSNGGCNSSDPKSFAPTNLNVSNWVDSFLALGVSSAVLTAKHGCGFLAWHTATTLPDGSPYTYHVSDEQATAEKFVAATTAAGLGHASTARPPAHRHPVAPPDVNANPNPYLLAGLLLQPDKQFLHERVRARSASAQHASAGPGECHSGAV